MIRHIILLTFALLLSACVDKPLPAKGAEALIYPEEHSFNIDVKRHGLTATQSRVEAIITDFLPAAPDTDWVISYRTLREQKIAKKAEQQLNQAGVSPRRIKRQQLPSQANDIVIKIKQYHLITENCSAYQINTNTVKTGCFVETLRMKQIASPSRLAAQS
ncbi:hypothetical protein [Photobacterium lipolyticum]|uniref:Uncharacterized protein n=1 Tax=Photobacterium lipolyticum TaxID=266810 RepID=A0A2T3N4P7_9GAMM|nr:hypothetical protein [Photobacterium lipolyticum]PSW07393.1 hypothetical protein C9I89_01345 [Photobacterium lipolyticum]